MGGLYAEGRWHSKGRRIVYTSEHPALALLEVLAHLDRGAAPVDYQLLAIELPDDLTVESLRPDLAPDESLDLAPDETRAIGDRWLNSASSLVLRVPSVVAPHSWNYLINPIHSGFPFTAIRSVERWPLDARLIP
jgi:RES domain-containing protein